MLALGAPFVANEQLWASPARAMLAAADTSSFYLDIILSITILRSDIGWYSFLDVYIGWTSASIVAITMAIRFIECKHGEKYRHWRLPLLRLSRYHKILVVYCHAWQIRAVPKFVTDAELETAFMHQKITGSAAVDAFRVLMLTTGASGIIVFISRHLPFTEQLIVHAVMAVSNHALMAKGALRVLALPAFKKSTLAICEALSCSYKWATIFVHPGLEPDPFNSAGACNGQSSHNGQRGLVRLVLFTQFFSVFVIPVYLCYQHEARLNTELQQHLARSGVVDPREARRVAPVGAPWWKQLLLDAVTLGCFAVVAWTVLLVFDQEAMAGVDRLDRLLDDAAAYVVRLLR